MVRFHLSLRTGTCCFHHHYYHCYHLVGIAKITFIIVVISITRVILITTFVIACLPATQLMGEGLYLYPGVERSLPAGKVLLLCFQLYCIVVQLTNSCGTSKLVLRPNSSQEYTCRRYKKFTLQRWKKLPAGKVLCIKLMPRHWKKLTCRRWKKFASRRWRKFTCRTGAVH